MDTTSRQPSGLVVATSDRATLEAILDALAPTFVEPGPRCLREDDGTWHRMLLIPGEWVVLDVGPVAPEVYEAARTAYLLGAVEVYALTHELTRRPLRRLTLVRSP